jgi:hypothetical protein
VDSPIVPKPIAETSSAAPSVVHRLLGQGGQQVRMGLHGGALHVVQDAAQSA